ALGALDEGQFRESPVEVRRHHALSRPHLQTPPALPEALKHASAVFDRAGVQTLGIPAVSGDAFELELLSRCAHAAFRRAIQRSRVRRLSMASSHTPSTSR